MFREEGDALVATFRFANFIEAFSFMTEVAFVAEAQAHHPRWENVYGTVKVWLTTHDAGNTITEKDRRLAASISEVAARRGLGPKGD